MYNICFFCEETVGSGDPVWIFSDKKKEKVKRVLCCPQCKDKRKESVVAKIIGEIATFDFGFRKENEFARNLRLSSEILQKFIEFYEWLDKEKVCIENF